MSARDETTDLGMQLWQAVDKDKRSTYPVTVEPRLLIRALDELYSLSRDLESTRHCLEQTRHELTVTRSTCGGVMVDRDRLRGRLATALELAEDGGVDITDEDIAERIASRRRDDEVAA